MSVTDEIKDRIDIVDLVSESVELRRSGKNYTGFCPFHHNVNTPSFVVFPDTQTWHCFGECDEGGDVFNFIMKKEGWEFTDALQNLADRTGVQIKPLTEEDQQQQEENERLRILLEEAVTFYRHQLLQTQPGRIARNYLEKRSLSKDTAEVFGLGYAPDSWSAALDYFQSKGYTAGDLEAVGLVSERDEGGYYDRFRHRLMIPIRDRRGKMAGFGARILDPEDVPKYLNSPQTVLFDKGKLLYGLDLARKSIRSEDEVVIVEGYMGVIAPYQHGFQNLVAQMGTALSEHQLAILKRYTHKLVIAMDSDAAGQKATLRGLQVARETLDRSTDPVFNARGLLRQEARLQADIRVLTLPEGMDPDDVVNQDPAGWQKLVEEARPIVAHVMETLARGKDLADPKVKTEIASQVLPIIEDLPNPIERDTYLQELARKLRLNEQTLLSYRPRKKQRSSFQRSSPVPAQEKKTQEKPREALKGDMYEAHCVGILLREPELIYRVDRELGKDGLNRFSEKDFQNTNYRILIRIIREALQQHDEEPQSYILHNLSDDFVEVASNLLDQTLEFNIRTDKVLEDLMRAILSLRQRKISKSSDHYRYLLETNHQNGDYKALEYQKNITNILQEKHKIDKAMKRYTSRTAALNS